LGEERVERRLVAILAADIVGYSRLIGSDEEGTLAALKTIRRELVDPRIAEHKGRIVKTTGDGLLVEFASVVDALRCAVEVQREMAERNANQPTDRRIDFRIGIHQGDVVVEDGDIFGDGVNIAARLEELAKPGGICTSARVQEDASGKLELAFVDFGEQQLKNIARPVRVYTIPLDTESAKASGLEQQTLPLPDKPSIAVLPFANLSGDPEQAYFADGMVEEIITALSRIRWLFVIARNSSFTYKGRPIDVKEVGRDLGVRYVLEGSVRKAAGRVRITAQLVEAKSGAHLWADRFDGSLEDVFDLQDQVAASVAGVIEPALQAAETARSVSRPTHDLTAYDLYLRAVATFFPIGKEQVCHALELLEQAIAIDGHYGPALCWAAICCWQMVTDGWSDEPQAARQRAVTLARHALEAAPDDPGVLANSTFVLAWFGEDIGTMLGLVDRALALNPSFARGWYLSGLLRTYAGMHDRAIEHVETAMRLSPRERFGSPLVVLGLAHFFKRQFDDAAAQLRLAMQENPGSPAIYRALAACYAQMGQVDEARHTVERLRALTSVVVPADLPWRKSEDRDLFMSGLRLAMRKTK
jgi:TolB-like protein/class 3 adenylate cyclase